ncbi:MAG: cell division protein ZapA [Bacteroidetes bacterium]|jgi:cell division protein ZapA (FtsZ GTPase activity inhibitor)|nr:cell division protein ZapA [Bacteroidota bacterium]MBP7257760.1 cell division protein ZapA [Chitinophagales bacterium]MBK7505476.1 cell division protein ZapA [Bacteroidota bacterium]MBK7639455.1 cell division protein ZapA [Bacteroidota bacterium]MBK8671871.1 cell division protein ZapA [Bacteroidota bacterium]
MADEMVNINVVIADRPYRLKINQEEEDKVRDIAKAINDKIKEYTQVFSSKDKQDFLAMIALQNGVEAMKNKSVDGSQVMEEMENVSNRLDQLDELLDLALSR